MLLIFESAKVLPGNLRAPDNQQVVLWGARVDQMFNPNYNVIEVVLRFLGRCGRYTIGTGMIPYRQHTQPVFIIAAP
jgi:hypothetical protein